jgi:hypothetical protein
MSMIGLEPHNPTTRTNDPLHNMEVLHVGDDESNTVHAAT